MFIEWRIDHNIHQLAKDHTAEQLKLVNRTM